MAKVGRKPGVRIGSRPDSRAGIMAALGVGDSVWVETTQERYSHDQRSWNIPRNRRPVEAADHVYAARAYTAVGHWGIGDTRLLICITRTK
jgi:hypothetical protein